MTEKMPKPDDVVSGYRIVRAIGKGGMGAVFEGKHETTGERAAIKVLHARLAQDPESLARFLNEGKAIAALHHPGIVKLLESGQIDGGGCFIAMEYVDGETLSARLKREKRLGRAGLRLGVEIASALQAAHKRNIVHRDLKPSNILLPSHPTEETHVRIIDFGIAKMTAEDREVQDFHTRTGTMIGTPVYMAPEQCRGVTVTDKTDVYALGVILYQMLTGRPPFYSQADGDILAMHILVPPKPVRELEPAVPEKVAQFVEKMLAKEGADRPSMAEVEWTLRELADDPAWTPDLADDSKTSVTPTPISAVTAEGLPTHMSLALGAPTIGGMNGQTASKTKAPKWRVSLAIALAILIVAGSFLGALTWRSQVASQAVPQAASQAASGTAPTVPKPISPTTAVPEQAFTKPEMLSASAAKPTEKLPEKLPEKPGTLPASKAVTPARTPPSTRPQKATGPTKVRKNDNLIFDFKTHRKLN